MGAIMPERPSLSSEELFVKVQLGVRMNRRVVKVLKATAEYMDMPFAALLESMAVANFEGHCLFGPEVLKQIERFSEIYGLDKMLDAMAQEAEGYDAMQEAPERPRRK
jgi:hypothetical protein